MDKIFKAIIWPVILSPLVYLIIVWNTLPGKVAVHFNMNGNPDRFGPKSELAIGIGIITGITILIYLFLPFIYKIDPKKTAVENKSRLLKISVAIALFLTFISCIVINSANKGNGIHLNIKVIFGSIGLLWCILGNYMYNIKPNYFAGFRIPWTLNNEDNWKYTHRLAGKLWFAGGLIIAITAFLASQTIIIVVFTIIVLIIIITPVIYSYRLYRKAKG